MRVLGITHVALELSSPTRMERWLRDIFGLQLLRHGYRNDEYVRIVGAPDDRDRRGFLHLYNRPFIPRGRLRFIAVAVDEPIEEAVAGLRRRGYQVDGDDVLRAPGHLHVKIDYRSAPRPFPDGDPAPADEPVDPHRPCLWRSIHHVAVDAADPRALLDWQRDVFGMTHERHHDRRGEVISQIYYPEAPTDAIGRRMSILPIFLRPGRPETAVNHIAFEVDDAEGAIAAVEGRGAPVDRWQDAIIHGPEEVWYQIDSRTTPFPVDHPANRAGQTLVPYHNR